jgi:hypothetical protein
MAWIDTAPPELLKVFARNASVCIMITKIDGTILWANHAFCELMRYTLQELIDLGWIKISVDDASLRADIEEASRLDAYNLSYSVTKQFTPKNSAPLWGVLNVMRYPSFGEMECCCCTFEPLKNGTATAFSYAIEHSKSVTGELTKMKDELAKLTTQTTEQQWINSTIQMAMKHPKLALSVIVLGAALSGFNNVIEIFQKVGILHTPITVTETVK